MAVILRSNMPYRGNIADLPPLNAPMPADASFYSDFLADLHITVDYRGDDPTRIFNFASMRDRYVRNADGGYSFAAAGSPARDEFNASSQNLGLLLEGANNQMLAPTQRMNLGQSAVTGLTVIADGGTPANEWDRWYALSPSGDGEHSLALASEAAVATNHRRTFAIELRPGSTDHRYVQLSSGTPGDADDYANFDLLTKTVVQQGAGAVFAGVVPTTFGAICYIQYVSAYAGIEAPTVSIIATPSAVKQAAALASNVGGIRARLPHFITATGTFTRVPPRSPMPSAGAAVLGDRLKLVSPPADFTFLVRAICPPWANAFTPTLAAIAQGDSQVNGVSIRTTAGNPLAVVTRTSNAAAVAHSFSITIQPNQPLVFAFAKQGNILRIALPTETYEGELPQLANGEPFILSSPVSSEGWDGHLQRVIGWSHGKSLSELQALLAEGI